MRIKPTDRDIKNVFETGFYSIPRFQRPYSWDRENVQDFWNDVIASEERDYFIGSMVFYRRNQNSDLFHVVDGQQRLLTITILLAALRNAMNSFGAYNLALGIQNLIERQDLNNETHFVLKSETPYPYLQECIQKYGDADLEPDLGQEERTLKDAFDLLSEQIRQSVHALESDPSIPRDNLSKLIRSRLEEFRDAALRLKVIFIELDDEDDAYIIFETLNTRGKDLEVSDLVKNHITRLVRPRGAQVDVAREKWNEMLLLFDGSAADINRNKFLLHSWLSQYEFTSEKKLFKKIKTRIRRDNVSQYLENLCREAIIYRQILEPAFGNWTNEEGQLTRSLEALSLFRVQQPLPYGHRNYERLPF